MMSDKINIFISWSGPLSMDVAKALREWLPYMFDNAVPWTSPTDIDAGSLWLEQIQGRIDGSAIGIMVVTKENIGSPWLNFEAGALSRTVQDYNSRVIPILVDFENLGQLTGPLAQFQGVMLDEEGISQACQSIANALGLNASTIGARYRSLWPELYKEIAIARHSLPNVQSEPIATDRDIIEQTLNQVSMIHREFRRDTQKREKELETRISYDPAGAVDRFALELAESMGIELFTRSTGNSQGSLVYRANARGTREKVDELVAEIRERFSGKMNLLLDISHSGQ